MKREAFKMFLKSGYEKEYERRHAAIWPELKKMLSDGGVYDYSIYWDKETNILFACQKTKGEESSQDMGANPIVQKMVGLYGRYHEGESRQFSGNHTPA